MFDNLVESTTAKGETAKNSAFFGVTAIVLGALFIGLFVFSLFNTKLTLGEEDLALNELVAPVALPDDAPPPPPAPEDKPQQKAAANPDAPKNMDILKDPVESMDQPTTPPDKASAERSSATPVRPDVPFIKGNVTERATGGGDVAGPARAGAGGGGSSVVSQAAKPVVPDDDAPPPAPVPKPSPEKPKVPAIVSGGVVNGKARNLVQPPYPPAAKAVRASGVVAVQVTIDEAGNVISAAATSGHPLLRSAAVQAARASKFTPTQLSGQPVKVTGIINYNFTAQ